MKHRDYFIRSLIDFAFRRKHPALALILAGTGLLGVLLAGLAFDLSVPTARGVVHLSFSTEGASGLVTWLAAGVAVALAGVGLLWLIADWRRADRRKVLAVELRGLRDWKGAPLVDAVPPSLEGQRVEILVDVRQRVADGFIIDPDAALERLMGLRARLDQYDDGKDRSDLAFVAGGLAPVPLSFLTGILLDDEAPLTFLDWDRDARLWSALDGEDDGERFIVEGLSDVPEHASEVILAVSGSYLVDEPAALSRAGKLPVVRLRLPSPNTRNHWSAAKQQALASEFRNVMATLKGRRIRKVHLFLAAASSLVLRLGATYDKRNLPRLVVYQYEGERFTWGVEMPVSGLARPAVLRASTGEPGSL